MLNIATLRCLHTTRCLYGSRGGGQWSSTWALNAFETLTRAGVKLGRHVTHTMNSGGAIIGGLWVWGVSDAVIRARHRARRCRFECRTKRLQTKVHNTITMHLIRSVLLSLCFMHKMWNGFACVCVTGVFMNHFMAFLSPTTLCAIHLCHIWDRHSDVRPHGFQLLGYLTKMLMSIMLCNRKNVYVTWMSAVSLLRLIMAWLV